MDPTKWRIASGWQVSGAFLGRPFFRDPRTLLGLWLILGVVSCTDQDSQV